MDDAILDGLVGKAHLGHGKIAALRACHCHAGAGRHVFVVQVQVGEFLAGKGEVHEGLHGFHNGDAWQGFLQAAAKRAR